MEGESREQRIADIVGRWRDRAERGEPVDLEALVRAHPDLEDALRARFAAAELLERRLATERGDPPASIGEYRILREIGRGGMGVVYEAEQTSMRRRIALKVLYPSVTSSPNAVQRFQREAWAAGRLKHTNIVAVYQLGEERGVWYCAMELVQGKPLSEVIADLRRARRESRESRRAMQVAAGAASSGLGGRENGTRAYYVRVAEMFADVADALHVAHTSGVIHRDVKPANLLLDANGALKLVDFGLARLDESPDMTLSRDVLGTPLYMSPEQVAGKRDDLDHRTDVYSLGATLYETLTLHPPFDGRTVQDLSVKILGREPVRPRRRDPRIPRDLETIVLKALDKEPSGRYGTAGDLATDLRRFAQGSAIRARRIGLLGRAWRLARRHRAYTALSGTAVVLSVLLASLAVLASRERARRVALEYDALCRQAGEAAALSWSVREEAGSSAAGHGAIGENGNDAAALLDRAIALAPERPEAYFARALARVGPDIDPRLEDLDAARTHGFPQHSIHLARAQVFRLAGRAADAAQEEALAATLPRAGAADAYLEGYLLVARGERTEALPLLAEAVRTAAPGSVLRYLAHYWRALAREQEGDFTGALEDLLALRAEGDESIETEVRIGALWHRLGEEERAEALFRDATERASAGAEEARHALCLACLATGQAGWHDRATAEGMRTHKDSTQAMLDRIAFLWRYRRAQEAFDLADGILARDATCVDALNAKGNALAGMGKLREALEAYDAAKALSPGNAGVLTNRGNVLRRIEGPQRALEAYAEALEANPFHAPAHRNRGFVLLELGQPAEALKAWDRATQLDPLEPRSHVGRAAAWRKLGRFDEAIQAADRALELDSNCVDALNEKGIALRLLGKSNDALAALDLAAAADPDNAGVRFNRARLLAELNRPEDALADYDHLLELVPPNADVRLKKGNILLSLRRPTEALNEYDQALGINLGFVPAHIMRSQALAALGQGEEALKSARTAVDLDPKDAIARNTLGEALNFLGQKREALAAFQEAAALAPQLAEFHFNSGKLLLELGDPPKAIDTLKEAVRLAPEDANARFELARAFVAANRPSDALDAAAEVVRLEPDGARGRALRGDILRNQGTWAEALKEYEEALRSAPEDAAILNAMGQVLWRLGKRTEAAGAWEKVVAARPEDLAVRVNLAVALSGTERGREAEAHFERVLHAAPDDCAALNGYAWLLAESRDPALRNPALAADLARRAVALHPERAAFQNTLGVALLRAGRWEESLRAFHRSMDLHDGGDAGDWLYAAMAHAHLHHADEARRFYERAAEWMEAHRPDDPGLKRVLDEASALLGTK